MGTSKKAAKRGRRSIGRNTTNASEGALTLVDFDRERTLRRLAHYEQWAREWMRTPDSPFRLPAQAMLKWIPVARDHLEQGRLAVKPLLFVERYFGWTVWMQAVAHSGKFLAPPPKGALWQAVATVLRTERPDRRLSWSRVGRQVVQQLPDARVLLDPWRLTYGDGEEIHQAGFKVLLSRVRRSLRQQTI